MVVASSYQDVGLISRIEDIVSSKAKVLNLDYNSLTLAPKDEQPFDFEEIGDDIIVRYEDGRIILMFEPSDVSDLTPDLWERVIEHQLCHCKNHDEGLYRSELFMLEGQQPHEFYPLAFEMDKSFSEYFCSLRQINVFGRKNFEDFQLHGLEDFFKDTDGIVMELERFHSIFFDAKIIQYNSILGLFKEYIKNTLINYESPSISGPIMDISRMLIRNIREIGYADLHWIDKTKMLFYTGCVLNTEYAIVDSYLEDRLVRADFPMKDDYISELAEKLELEGDCSRRLENIRKNFW